MGLIETDSHTTLGPVPIVFTKKLFKPPVIKYWDPDSNNALVQLRVEASPGNIATVGFYCPNPVAVQLVETRRETFTFTLEHRPDGYAFTKVAFDTVEFPVGNR